jgi:hypothetical protein
MSWYNQPFRHSLAARGIKTSFKGKWKRLIIAEGKPLGWGSNEFMEWLKEHNPEEYEKMKEKIRIRALKQKLGAEKQWERRRELKKKIGEDALLKLEEEKRALALRRALEDEFPGVVLSGTVKPKKEEKEKEEKEEEEKEKKNGYEEEEIEGVVFAGKRSLALRHDLGEELEKDSKNTHKISDLRSELSKELRR